MWLQWYIFLKGTITITRGGTDAAASKKMKEIRE